jgi:hypothetical protein
MKLVAPDGGAARLPGVRRAVAADVAGARADKPALYDLAIAHRSARRARFALIEIVR